MMWWAAVASVAERSPSPRPDRRGGRRELAQDAALQPGWRRHRGQQAQQLLPDDREPADLLPAAVAPVELLDGFGPLPAGEHAEGQLRRYLSEPVAVHTRYTGPVPGWIA